MTVVSVLLASLALQGTKPVPMRTIEVKPAGLSVAVPKSWGSGPKDTNLTASLKIPIPGSKNLGRMELGYVIDESGNVDGFLEASKNVLTVGGNTVERQWKVDIMESPLALTRYSKDGSTTVRGVLFRPSKSKFVITISSVTEEFSKVEPYLQSTLESLKEIKIVEPKKPVEAVERNIKINRESPGHPKATPITAQITAGTRQAVLHFPAGTVVSKLGDGSVSAKIPNVENPILLTAYAMESTQPSNLYQTKAAETSKLFKGAITRIDETYPNNPDRQIRDFVWRTGTSVKDSGPLLTTDCVISQAGPVFAYASFTSTNEKFFKKDQKAVTDFLKTVKLIDKP